jgi:hypothetical protein
VSDTLDHLKLFARFPFALRRFLRHTPTLDEARRTVRERLERREQNLLDIVERCIYGWPRSPYLALLKRAGCELGDLRALVKQKGLEGALRDLREEGVYVTFEEFKGRAPIVRNGLTIPVDARDFDNPFARRDFETQTGGSTGSAINVGANVDHIADRQLNEMLALHAHGLLGAPTAVWNYTLPAGSPGRPLMLASIGQPAEHWFTPTGLRDSKHWVKYNLATYYMIFCMRLYGVRVPLPEVVKMDQAVVVARWIHETLKTHKRCLLFAGVSRALRLCIAAREAGLDLTGAALRGGGEPVTPAKVEVMRQVGARYVPNYAMSETSYVAAACARPLDGSDTHLLKDAFVLFTYPHYLKAFDMSVPAFNLTTLLPTVPKLMFNVQVDDYGVVEERACGCELESHGYTTHIRDIHSYSKLVGEGVTLIGSEMMRILEEVLPARFGGTPLDYQLSEEEDEQGFTRVHLVVSPRVQIADERQVIDAFLAAMRESSAQSDAARIVWQQTDTIRIKRREPIPTARGKLLPMRIRRSAETVQAAVRS